MTTSQVCRASLVVLCAISAAIAHAQPATPPQSAPALGADTLADYARREPAVAAALELPRTTPAQQLKAVLVLIDLGRPEAAALILPELLDTKIDAPTGAALVREFGPARFMELIRLDDGQDAANPLAGAGKFAQACLDAAAAEASDPRRLAELIAQLQSPSEDDRQAARADLRATGQPAVVATFAALGAAKTEDARAQLLAALADTRPLVDEPTLAVLADARGQFRRDAAELAGHLKLADAVPWLAVLAVSADAKVAAAAQTALSTLGISQPEPADAQQLVRRRLADLEAAPLPRATGLARTWWSWNPATSQLESAEFAENDLRTLAAGRLARALAEVGAAAATPADRRMIAVRAVEEAALLQRELPAEFRALLDSMTPTDMSAALASAVKGQRYAAAAAFATELGRRGDDTVLATTDGLPSPLAAALSSPVRSLRFAALSAVMRLAPARQFPGSSAVTDALWHFAAGAGHPAAVAAAPVLARASDWAGQLRSLDFDATAAQCGRDAIVAAVDRAVAPRLALVVLDSDINNPAWGEVYFQLRTNERTARVPILIAASAARLANAQDRTQSDPLTVVAPRPRSPEAMRELVERAQAVNPTLLPSEDDRVQQAAAALAWIARLLADRAPYDELRRDAGLISHTLYMYELSAPSIAVLAALGTADSQALLTDFASMRALPIDDRRRAAAALADSIGRFGVQLTSAQINHQYDRYNASETADAETQQVLGSVLDALEKK